METLITQTNRCFDVLKIQWTMHGVLVIGLIHKDLIDKYEATKKSSKSFEERFLLAFIRKQTLAQEMQDVRQKEDTDGFIKKIDTLVEKLLKQLG